jgi:hypothetical protein
MEALGGERRYSSYSFTTSALDGNEWSAPLPSRVLPPVPIVLEAGWAPEPVWTQRLEEKSFAPAGDRTPIARSSSHINTLPLESASLLWNQQFRFAEGHFLWTGSGWSTWNKVYKIFLWTYWSTVRRIHWAVNPPSFINTKGRCYPNNAPCSSYS